MDRFDKHEQSQQKQEYLVAERYFTDAQRHIRQNTSGYGWDKAWECIKKAIEIAPDYKSGHDLIVLLATQDRDFSAKGCTQKLDVLTAILNSNPTNSDARDARALIYHVLGRIDEAKTDYDHARQGDPQVATSVFIVQVVCKTGTRVVAAYPDSEYGTVLAYHLFSGLCISFELQEGLLGKDPGVREVRVLKGTGTMITQETHLTGLLGRAVSMNKRRENDTRG